MPADPVKAVFLDYDTVDRDDLDASALRSATGELLLLHEDASQLGERLRDARIVLTNKCVLSHESLRAAAHLRLIALSGTGTDNIDLAGAQALGIAVCNVRGYCTASVVQHVWALILGLTQHVREYSLISTSGAWSRHARGAALLHPIRELAGRTFGVIGYGELGRAVAQTAEAFGMRVVIAERPGAATSPGRLPLMRLLSVADIVSLHCPLNERTRGLIGGAQLAQMKPDALLINTARGALVDSYALAAALRAGALAGAGIDVLPDEPPGDDEALLDPAVPNLLLTPHVAWAAREARQRCLEEMAANVRDFLEGGARNRVV